jgi:putative membrane protein
MVVIVNLLLWLHLVALALGIGGGLGMSQVGPRLVAAAPDERGAWWPLATVFARVAGAGLVLLLITGPLMLWLKFGGFGGLNGWFKVKLALVAIAIVTVGLSEWGFARLRRGDEGGGRLMTVTGPLTMLTVLAIVLSAVFTFN